MGRETRWGMVPILILAAWGASSAPVPEPGLLLDAPSLDRLELRAYRRCDGPFAAPGKARLPTREGLSDLRISGSAQFSKRGWDEVRGRLSGVQAVVVDLRREPHGFIAGGIPVSWQDGGAGPAAAPDRIRAQERSLLATLAARGHIELALADEKPKPVETEVGEAWTEEAMVTPAGILYRRCPVGQGRPEDDTVDALLDLVRALPKGTWYHFHCDDGGQRTTMFMAMMDMVANARKVRLEDILARQRLLGGADLTESGTPPPGETNGARERAAFLKEFYEYARANGEGAPVSWSSWRNSRSVRPPPSGAQPPKAPSSSP